MPRAQQQEPARTRARAKPASGPFGVKATEVPAQAALQAITNRTDCHTVPSRKSLGNPIFDKRSFLLFAPQVRLFLNACVSGFAYFGASRRFPPTSRTGRSRSAGC
jgi:hypothetical protein